MHQTQPLERVALQLQHPVSQTSLTRSIQRLEFLTVIKLRIER